MKVAELVKLLQEMPQDAEVSIYRSGEPMCAEDYDPQQPKLCNGVVEL